MLAEAEEELETTRSRLYDQVEAHRAEVAEVDKAIEASTRELQLLKHYKDKEYPVRQIRIEQLKETQEESQSTQMDQLEEIEMQVAEEREQYQQQLEAKKLQLETEAAEACMAQVKKSVRLQAMQNKIMRKELSIHQKKQQELNEAIVELKNALSCMRLEARDQKRNHLPPVTVQTK